MWTYVKNLLSAKFQYVDTQDLFLIKCVKGAWIRKKFPHKCMEEVDNTNEKYALVLNEKMVRVVILDMGATREELEMKVQASRPKAPKRFSMSEVAVHLSAFHEAEEHKLTLGGQKRDKSIDPFKRNAKSEKGKKPQNDNTKKRKKIGVKDGKEDDKAEGRNGTGNVDEDKTENSNAEDDNNGSDGLNGKNTEHESKTEGENDNDTEKRYEQKQQKNAKADGDGDENGTGEGNGESGYQQQGSSGQSHHDDNPNLQEKIDMLTEKYQEAQLEIIRLKTENNMLKEQNKTLSNIARELKKLPEKIGHSSKANAALDKVKSITLEDEFKDVKWNEETHIYVGCGRVLPRSSLDQVDDEETSFNSRGVRLMNMILDGNIKDFSKSGMGKDVTLKKIPEKNIVAFKKIMKSMSWASSEDCSDKKIKSFLNKQPNEERRKVAKAGKQGEKRKSSSTSGAKKKRRKEDSEEEEDDEDDDEDDDDEDEEEKV